MVTSIAALLLLLLGAWGLGALTGRRTEECWPVCFCMVPGWLYGFYCFGLIRVGLSLLYVGLVALFLAGWRKIGAFGDYCRRLLTPGNVLYLCFCLIFLLFFSRNPVSRHDELRLWGAVPKAIHETGRLQLGTASPIFSTMQSYPPGLPLVGTFFTAFTPAFSEGALFVGYACMALSFLVPAFSCWQWKQWPLLAPVGLAVLLTPFLFTSHMEDTALFGMTLFVDPLLGILAGYAFFQAWKGTLRNGQALANFCLTLVVLCLLKDTGLGFALMALLVALISGGPSWRLVIPALGIGLGAGSWQLLLRVYDVHALVGVKEYLPSGEAISNVLRALGNVNVVAYKLPLGPLLSFAVVFPLLLVLYLLAFRRPGERRWSVAVGLVASGMLFLYGYCLIYGRTLESFARYLSTPLLALATCIVLTVVPRFPDGALAAWLLCRGKAFAAALVGLCLLVVLAVMALWNIAFTVYPQLPQADEDAARIRTAVEADLAPGQTGWIYLVMAGDGWENSFYHHRIFFDLISPNINLRNGLAQTQVVIPGLENPAQVWAQELTECDYVYLLSVEDAFVPVFQMFSEEEPQAHGLYRVIHDQGALGIRLEQVG